VIYTGGMERSCNDEAENLNTVCEYLSYVLPDLLDVLSLPSESLPFFQRPLGMPDCCTRTFWGPLHMARPVRPHTSYNAPSFQRSLASRRCRDNLPKALNSTQARRPPPCTPPLQVGCEERRIFLDLQTRIAKMRSMSRQFDAAHPRTNSQENHFNQLPPPSPPQVCAADQRGFTEHPMTSSQLTARLQPCFSAVGNPIGDPTGDCDHPRVHTRHACFCLYPNNRQTKNPTHMSLPTTWWLSFTHGAPRGAMQALAQGDNSGRTGQQLRLSGRPPPGKGPRYAYKPVWAVGWPWTLP
jgi:hypothetical protein